MLRVAPVGRRAHCRMVACGRIPEVRERQCRGIRTSSDSLPIVGQGMGAIWGKVQAGKGQAALSPLFDGGDAVEMADGSVLLCAVCKAVASGSVRLQFLATR
jgi:hypothetical protein